jgi:hypothetical protein
MMDINREKEPRDSEPDKETVIRDINSDILRIQKRFYNTIDSVRRTGTDYTEGV